jgi:glutamate racemase
VAPFALLGGADARSCPDAPILFFDSGLGGLTVLGPTRLLLPTAPIVYAADYAGLPYGQKSEAELSARVPALLGRLVERYQPRLAVIACNTASTIALHMFVRRSTCRSSAPSPRSSLRPS